MKREGLSKNLVNSNWWKVHKPFFILCSSVGFRVCLYKPQLIKPNIFKDMI